VKFDCAEEDQSAMSAVELWMKASRDTADPTHGYCAVDHMLSPQRKIND